MAERYIVFNNGSQEVRDMENFFKENGIKYVTIHKESDRDAEILAPHSVFPYYSNNFNSLKSFILEQAGIEN